MAVDLSQVYLRQNIQRRIPGNIRVIQFLLYFAVLVFAFLGSMWGFLLLIPALGTLFFSWYFMGQARVNYEYQLDGSRLTVIRHSGMRAHPKAETFLQLEFANLVVMADENSQHLDEAERLSKAAEKKRVTYDVSAHDPNRACAVAYAMGVEKEEGRWLKVYLQPTTELMSYVQMICPEKVFVHPDGQ